LRVLYPECDELLPCETLGGGENWAYLLTNGSGPGPDACSRYMGPYSPADATDSFVNWTNEGTNSTNYTWVPAPFGRYVASAECVEPFATDWMGQKGPFRLALLGYKALVFPIIMVLIFKAVGLLCLKSPWMADVRKRNDRLIRIAAKRKAEVRRMTEGGQEFAVKRAAKTEGTQAQDAITRLKALSAQKEDQDKVGSTGATLLSKLKKGGDVVTSTSDTPAGAATPPPSTPPKDPGSGIAAAFLKGGSKAKVQPTPEAAPAEAPAAVPSCDP